MGGLSTMDSTFNYQEPKSVSIYKKLLPIMGIIESIATKGQSPGTAAIQQYKNLDTGRQTAREDWELAEKGKTDAMQRQVYGTQLEKSARDTEKDNLSLENAKKEAIKKAKYLSDIQAAKTPEERKIVIDNYLAENEPLKLKEIEYKLSKEDGDLKRKLDAEARAEARKIEAENRAADRAAEREARKAASATEYKAAGYAARLAEANDILKLYEPTVDEDGTPVMGELSNKFDPTSQTVIGMMPQRLKSSERLQYEQATRNWVNAVLRPESGAVINPEEFENARIQYFGQPNDTPEVMAQKQANRRTKEKFLSMEGGKATTKAAASPAAAPAPTTNFTAATVPVGQVYNGHRYIGGDRKNPQSWQEVK